MLTCVSCKINGEHFLYKTMLSFFQINVVFWLCLLVEGVDSQNRELALRLINNRLNWPLEVLWLLANDFNRYSQCQVKMKNILHLTFCPFAQRLDVGCWFAPSQDVSFWVSSQHIPSQAECKTLDEFGLLVFLKQTIDDVRSQEKTADRKSTRCCCKYTNSNMQSEQSDIFDVLNTFRMGLN